LIDTFQCDNLQYNALQRSIRRATKSSKKTKSI